MGTWGLGNFDSDGAADLVARTMSEWAKQVTADLGLSRRGRKVAVTIDVAEGEVMGRVGMLLVLVRSGVARPPPPDVVAKWRRAYLALWDAEAARYGATGQFLARRRNVIDRTFEELERRATGIFGPAKTARRKTKATQPTKRKAKPKRKAARSPKPRSR